MSRSKPRCALKALGATSLLVMLLTGCAGMGKSPQEAATERAQERLDYFLAGDFAQAYEYLSPGYRSSVSLTEYLRKATSSPIAWEDAEVVTSDCTESSCKLNISLDIVIYGAIPGASEFETIGAVTENWIKSGGTWYMVPSD